jgi:hypothetical protein
LGCTPKWGQNEEKAVFTTGDMYEKGGRKNLCGDGKISFVPFGSKRSETGMVN